MIRREKRNTLPILFRFLEFPLAKSFVPGGVQVGCSEDFVAFLLFWRIYGLSESG